MENLPTTQCPKDLEEAAFYAGFYIDQSLAKFSLEYENDPEVVSTLELTFGAGVPDRNDRVIGYINDRYTLSVTEMTIEEIGFNIDKLVEDFAVYAADYL